MKPEQDTSVDAVFWSQWQEHRDYLYRCCLKYLGNPTDAQDALSEVMLKAWNKIRTSAQPIQNIKAWLVKLTSHHCIDTRRKRGFLTEMPPEAELASQEETPVGAATRRQLVLFFRNAIENLSPKLRETFRLYLEQKHSLKEIAQQLNISYETVRQRISQARKILRHQWQEYNATPSPVEPTPGNPTAPRSQAPAWECPSRGSASRNFSPTQTQTDLTDEAEPLDSRSQAQPRNEEPNEEPTPGVVEHPRSQAFAWECPSRGSASRNFSPTQTQTDLTDEAEPLDSRSQAQPRNEETPHRLSFPPPTLATQIQRFELLWRIWMDSGGDYWGFL